MEFGGHKTVYAEYPVQGAYGSPHWVDFSQPCDGDADDPSEWRFPVNYRFGDTIRIARIEFCDAIPDDPNTLMDVLGVGPDGHRYFGDAYVDPFNNVVYATNLVCTLSLPNRVRFYNTYDITWTLLYFPNGQPTGIPVSAGRTKNKMYVSKTGPMVDVGTGEDFQLWESMLELSCGAANGLFMTNVKEEQEVAAAIWNAFATLEVKRKQTNGFNYTDGWPLTYWGVHANPEMTAGTSHADLLYLGWGKCGAWQRLLRACMSTQGIVGTRAYLFPYGHHTTLLVKDFSHSTGTTGIPTYPYIWEDFTSLPGIPAQHNFTPVPEHKRFTNHALNRYNGALPPATWGGQETWLDPSYGVSTLNAMSYLQGAMFAIGARALVGSTWRIVYRLVSDIASDPMGSFSLYFLFVFGP